jgi:hypothetical protein
MPYLSFLRLLLGVSFVGLTQAALGIPPGSSTVTVKVMNSVNPAHVKAPAAAAVFPAVPGKENLDADFYAFLIENTAKQTRVCFDIGIRKDPQNVVPVLAELFTSGEYVIPVDKEIPTQLTEGGVTLASIKSVIWR